MSSEIRHFILECLDTTDTYTEYNTNVVQIFCFKINVCILYTLHSGNHSQLGITVELASLLTVNPFIDVQVFHLASELCLEISCIEMSNRRSTTLSSDPAMTCEIATSACGLLAMTNLGASRR